jgi:hypothetical protein
MLDAIVDPRPGGVFQPLSLPSKLARNQPHAKASGLRCIEVRRQLSPSVDTSNRGVK